MSQTREEIVWVKINDKFWVEDQWGSNIQQCSIEALKHIQTRISKWLEGWGEDPSKAPKKLLYKQIEAQLPAALLALENFVGKHMEKTFSRAC